MTKSQIKQAFSLPTVYLHRLQAKHCVTSSLEAKMLRCFDRCDRVSSVQSWDTSQALRTNVNSDKRPSVRAHWAVEDNRGRKYAISCLTQKTFTEIHDFADAWSALDAEVASVGYQLRLLVEENLPPSMVFQAEMFMVQFGVVIDPKINEKCLDILTHQEFVRLYELVAELVEWSGKKAHEIYRYVYGMLAQSQLHSDPNVDPPMCRVGVPGTPGCLSPLVLGRRYDRVLQTKNSLSPQPEKEQEYAVPQHARQFINSKRGQKYRHLYSKLRNLSTPLTRGRAAELVRDCQLSLSSIYRFRRWLLNTDLSVSTFENVAIQMVSRRESSSGCRLNPKVQAIILGCIHEGYLVRPGQEVRISNLAELTQVIRRRCLDEDVPPPCRKTVQRILDQLRESDPLKFESLRNGTDSQDKLRPRLGRFQVGSTGAVLALDCTPCDIRLRCKDDAFRILSSGVRQALDTWRPWLIVVKDVATGVLLHTAIVEGRPKASSILIVLQAVFLGNHDQLNAAGVQCQPRGQGLPQRLRLDGGSEFVNKQVEAIMETLGIELLPRRAWNKHYGGLEERSIQVLTFSQHTLEGTTLNRFYLREPYKTLYVSPLTLPDLARFSARITEAYNLKAAPGCPLSRLEMEREFLDGGRSSWRELDEPQRRYIEQGMFPLESAICQTDGIHMHSLRYESKEIHGLITSRRRVEIRYNPHDIRIAWAIHPDTNREIEITAMWPVYIECSQPISLELWKMIYRRVELARANHNDSQKTAFEIAREVTQEAKKLHRNTISRIDSSPDLDSLLKKSSHISIEDDYEPFTFEMLNIGER